MKLKDQFELQNNIHNINANISNNIVPSPTISPGVCPQCGLIHPPVPPGQVCSMAPIKTKDNTIIDPTNFLTKMKLLISNQIEQRSVKDPEKFFQYITIELMKIMEGYKE